MSDDDPVTRGDCRDCGGRTAKALEQLREETLAQIADLKQTSATSAAEIRAIALQIVRLEETVKAINRRLEEDAKAREKEWEERKAERLADAKARADERAADLAALKADKDAAAAGKLAVVTEVGQWRAMIAKFIMPILFALCAGALGGRYLLPAEPTPPPYSTTTTTTGTTPTPAP
jgi:septal ring factor EnvC (AmiA/AmiB activator)